MIYLMEQKSGGQFDPPKDFTRLMHNGKLSEIEVREKDSKLDHQHRHLPFMPDLVQCERIPGEMLWRMPKVIYNTSPKIWQQLPDYMFILMTETFRDLIEKFDPGVHQFIPVDIVHKKSGQKYSNQGQFFWWNGLVRVCPQDVFDYEQMNAKGLLKSHAYNHTTHKKFHVGQPRYTIKGIFYDQYVGRRRAFGKHHIVFCLPCGTTLEEGDVHDSSLRPLVTEEFKAAVSALGIKGIDFKSIPTVDE